MAQPPTAGAHPAGVDGAKTSLADWRASTRVFLQPIAPPSILGLFGFASATFMVAGNLAWGFGGKNADLYLFPFAAAFGGIAQLAAALFAYKARDGLATAMHGAWGSFWIGFGILNLLFAVGVLKMPPGNFPAFGYWFITLAAITFSGAIAAQAESLGLAGVLHTLWLGAALLAVGLLSGVKAWETAGGWALVVSAALAWYAASAMMLEGTMGRVVLPMGLMKKPTELEGYTPGDQARTIIELDSGEPGVKRGQ